MHHMKPNYLINSATILLVGVTLGLSNSIACEDNPAKISIAVVGAQAGTDQNYYVVEIPETGEPKTTVEITGSGKTPCPTDAEKCTCQHNSDKVTPETDGNPKFTFSKTVGNQDPTDGPKVKWDVDSSTAPGEYKFKVTEIKQTYKNCPQGWSGGIPSKSNTQESDEVTVLAVKIDMQFANQSVCDGEEIAVTLNVLPNNVSNSLANGSFTCQKPGGGSQFDNPSSQGSKMVSAATDMTKWKIDNARWYSTQADHCNVTSDYEVVGTIDVKGVAINVKKGSFTADAAFGSCLDGVARTTGFWSGSPTYTTVLNQTTAQYETRVTVGPWVRSVTAQWTHSAPTNSQYNTMIRDEEEFHADKQMKDANHVRWGTAFIAANVMNPVQQAQPYIAATQTQSLLLAEQAFDASRTAEEFRSAQYLNQQNIMCDDEREAKASVKASHRAAMACAYKNQCP